MNSPLADISIEAKFEEPCLSILELRVKIVRTLIDKRIEIEDLNNSLNEIIDPNYLATLFYRKSAPISEVRYVEAKLEKRNHGPKCPLHGFMLSVGENDYLKTIQSLRLILIDALKKLPLDVSIKIKSLLYPRSKLDLKINLQYVSYYCGINYKWMQGNKDFLAEHVEGYYPIDSLWDSVCDRIAFYIFSRRIDIPRFLRLTRISAKDLYDSTETGAIDVLQEEGLKNKIMWDSVASRMNVSSDWLKSGQYDNLTIKKERKLIWKRHPDRNYNLSTGETLTKLKGCSDGFWVFGSSRCPSGIQVAIRGLCEK